MNADEQTKIAQLLTHVLYRAGIVVESSEARFNPRHGQVRTWNTVSPAALIGAWIRLGYRVSVLPHTAETSLCSCPASQSGGIAHQPECFLSEGVSR